MKKIIALFSACALLLAGNAVQAQSLTDILGGLAGAATNKDNGGTSTLGNILGNLAGTVFSAPVSLNGTYVYQGVAVGLSKSEGNVLSDLAGTAVSSGIESKINQKLDKVGIKPGITTFVFNSTDNTFTCTVMGIPLNGTYKVGDGENTVNLTFGKTLKYLSMTGTLKSTLNGCEMLFPANKLLAFAKKVASVAGKASSGIGAITQLADGYDQFKVGFKLSKQQ